MEAVERYGKKWVKVAAYVGHGVNKDRSGRCYMEISSFLLFDLMIMMLTRLLYLVVATDGI